MQIVCVWLLVNWDIPLITRRVCIVGCVPYPVLWAGNVLSFPLSYSAVWAEGQPFCLHVYIYSHLALVLLLV